MKYAYRILGNEARAESGQEVALLLAKAISDMEKTGKSLSEALEKVGGPLEDITVITNNKNRRYP